jgi:hypothetical protein
MLALVASGLAGCAMNPPAPAPDVTIKAAAEDVRNRLAFEMVGRGGRIVSLTDSRLIAEKPLDGARAILSQLMLGNAYSTSPVGTVTFIFLYEPGAVRVLGSAAVTSQSAGGQTNTAPAPANYAGMQRMLVDIKNELETAR